METLSQVNSNLGIIKPSINPVFGTIDSLSYQGKGDNLVEVKIRENNSGNIFTFTAFTNVKLDFKTIEIGNFKDFQFRLQEAFNNHFVVSVFHEDGKIVLLEITRQVFTTRGGGGGSGGSGGSSGGSGGP